MGKARSGAGGSGTGTNEEPISRDALRQRLYREALSVQNNYEKSGRCAWSEEDEAILLVHLALIGMQWRAISHNMKRSPDSIRNKLNRMVSNDPALKGVWAFQ